MTELTYFLLGFGFGFLTFIVLPITLIGLVSRIITRAKRKNPSNVEKIVDEMLEKVKASRKSVGGNEKGHTKENAIAILENEETGKKKVYSN